MSAAEQWHARVDAQLAASGIARLEPPVPGARETRAYFGYRGVRFVVFPMFKQRYLAFGIEAFGIEAFGIEPPLPPTTGTRPVEPLPRIRARRPTALDRRGLALGLNVQPRVDDPVFARSVYVESSDPLESVSALLRTNEPRAALLALLADEGVARVATAEARCLVTMTLPTEAPERLSSRLDGLLALARSLPAVVAPLPSSVPPPMPLEISLLVVFALCAWWPLVFFLDRYVPYRGPFASVTAALSFGSFVLLATVQTLRHRRRTDGLRRVAASVLALVMLCPSLIATAVLLANLWLPSERRTREAHIDDFECVSGRHGPSCVLRVRATGLPGRYEFRGAWVAEGERRRLWSALPWPRATGSGEATNLGGVCGPAELTELEGGLGMPVLESVRRTVDGASSGARCESRAGR